MTSVTMPRKRTRWYQNPRSRRKGLIALAFILAAAALVWLA